MRCVRRRRWLLRPFAFIYAGSCIGVASATGADILCCGDPLMVMVEGTGLSLLVAESRVVLSEISMAREAAAIAAARSVVAGSAPPSGFRFRRVRGWFRGHWPLERACDVGGGSEQAALGL